MAGAGSGIGREGMKHEAGSGRIFVNCCPMGFPILCKCLFLARPLNLHLYFLPPFTRVQSAHDSSLDITES